MTKPTRRVLLSQMYAMAAILIALPACNTAQRDAALEKLKDISQGFTDAVSQYGALLFPAEAKTISDNNAAIQKLAPGDWIGTARTLIGGMMRIALQIAPRIPFGGAADAVATVMAFLANFAGIAAGSATPARVPTEDEAYAAALLLLRRAP